MKTLRKHSQLTIQPYPGVRLAECVDAGTEVRPKVRFLEVLYRQVELPGKHVQLFLRDNVLFSFVQFDSWRVGEKEKKHNVKYLF